MKRARRPRLLWRLYAVGVVQLFLVAIAALVIGAIVSKLGSRSDVQALATRLGPLVARPAALASELEQIERRDGTRVSIYAADGALIASSRKPPLRPPPWLRAATEPVHAGPNAPHAHGPPAFDLAPLRAAPPDGARPERAPPSDFDARHERLPPPDFEGARPPFPAQPPEPPEPPPGAPPMEAYARFYVGNSEGVLVARFGPPRPSLLPPLLTLISGLIVVGVGAAFTARFIARPLARLTRAASAFGEGDLSARTELSRADELGDVLSTFDEMADRIQALLRSEKELLANVAHELRTPLARIRVALEIAGEGDAEAARTSLSEIAVDLAELEDLVDDVLRAARLDLADGAVPAQFALHLAAIAPRALAERAAERFRARHAERPLELEIAPALPELAADAVLFRRVIDNLLENSHKYSPDPRAPIGLRVSADAERVHFEVVDRGIGIPAADLPHVFGAFFRGERSRSRQTGGVGLGLTLAKRIVDAHAGSIDVSSNAGQGTAVRVSVPCLGGPH